MSGADWRRMLARASALREHGRMAEAIAAYRELLAAKPDLPDSWYNLAWLEKQARAFEAALGSYAQALAHGVSGPEEVHLNRAVIYSDHLHRPDEAEAELRAALKINPAYVPAWLNLGNLQEDRGDREAAAEAYSRALELEPANAMALARLAGVTTPRGADDPLIERLEAELARPNLLPPDRADLGFALGGLLDRAEAYDQAFAAYRAANLASRQSLPAGFSGYEPGRQEQFVDALIETFDRPARGESGGRAPVFICGLFRSGSTLVERILAGHGEVTPGGELDLIPALAAAIRKYPRSLASPSPETIEQMRRFYLRGIEPIDPGRGIVTDKRPDNFLHIGLIKTLFPDARIVHTIRDPIDNLLSMYFLHLDPGMSYALDLDDLAHWYGQYRRLMMHWRSLYPGDIFDVSYDELVREPEPVVAGLLKFLGLEWQDGCLDFHQSSAPVRTASVWQVREPLYTRSSGRWRNYERQLAGLRARLQEL